MFHQFYNDRYYHCKGAVNEDQFYNFCKKLITEFEIIDPNNHKQLFKEKGILLTFDDGLKSQFEIASKVLKFFDIKAIFFIFSSIFSNNFNLLEVYKYFSHSYFESIDEFYQKYFSYIFKNKSEFDLLIRKYDHHIKLMKSNSPFYSLNDIVYRLLRFEILSTNEFDDSHLYMIKKITGHKIEDFKEKLHINKDDINELIKYGNVIGNHSYSHAYDLHKKSYKDQLMDYKKSNQLLKKICKVNIDYCAFPFGLYDENTLKVINELDFKFSFLANHKNKFIDKKILSRFDHSLLISNNNVDFSLLK